VGARNHSTLTHNNRDEQFFYSTLDIRTFHWLSLSCRSTYPAQVSNLIAVTHINICSGAIIQSEFRTKCTTPSHPRDTQKIFNIFFFVLCNALVQETWWHELFRR
jgi:hypothetical protein